jgi:hypothetical protein
MNVHVMSCDIPAVNSHYTPSQANNNHPVPLHTMYEGMERISLGSTVMRNSETGHPPFSLNNLKWWQSLLPEKRKLELSACSGLWQNYEQVIEGGL